MTSAREADPLKRKDAAAFIAAMFCGAAAASFLCSGTTFRSMFSFFCFIGATEGVAM